MPTARQPRTSEETGALPYLYLGSFCTHKTHIINIKSYLLQTEDVYCTSLTHIHKTTIYTYALEEEECRHGKRISRGTAPPLPALLGGGVGGCAHSRSDQSQEESCPVDMSLRTVHGWASLPHTRAPPTTCVHPCAA
ncbi:intraflagellar transport protein 122-like protein [Platysternon megacephalum]|uniref:Intraflagellar transport protein 122-like protein n=1 Tax=Platysternon megacephalum TaxID=55544 RepID=A0A4D9E0Z3_9SAUR|nr:intraflagellar transport protein 122-like protein [Platysternon megacephalum]